MDARLFRKAMCMIPGVVDDMADYALGKEVKHKKYNQTTERYYNGSLESIDKFVVNDDEVVDALEDIRTRLVHQFRFEECTAERIVMWRELKGSPKSFKVTYELIKEV